MLTEVINIYYRQWQTIFIDPDVDRVTRNKKNMYFTEAMKFLAFRQHHLVIWAQACIYKEFNIPS